MDQSVKRYSLKTKDGCKRLMTLFVVIILVSSFMAALVSSNFCQVKVTHLNIDESGASLDADLYYPAGISDKDKLPAIIVSHGGSVAKGDYKGIAEEFARRGYVVINYDAYGSGMSEHPVNDDGGLGAAGYNVFATPSPSGALDVINYIRSLKFVDTTRIGMFGHSWGSTRTAAAVKTDCGYYTYNDIMINVLADTFGQKFTQSEITQDAAKLAASRLNKDQMAYYNSIAKEKLDQFNSRVKTVVLTGSKPQAALDTPAKVTVAGYEVQRLCQVNVAYINGDYDPNGAGALWSKDGTAKFLDGKAVIGNWYGIDVNTNTFNSIGDIHKINVADNGTLNQVIADKTSRIVMYNPETHSQQYFSTLTTSDACRVFEQTLSVNGSNPTGTTISNDSNIWPFRTLFNTIALLAMIGLIFPLVGLFINSKKYAGCVAAEQSETKVKFSKKGYLIISVCLVAITFFALYYGNAKGVMWFPMNVFWPLAGCVGNELLFLFILAGGSAILLVIMSIINKRKYGETGLKALNFKLDTRNILKTLLISATVLVVCYAAVALVSYLFNQDFRIFQTQFTEMTVDNWFVMLRYLILLIPCYLVMSAVINMMARKDIPQWKDTLITVIVGSIGVWLLLLVDVLSRSNWSGHAFSAFTCSYTTVFFVPMTVYISRKLYNMTHSIWAGALVNAFLVTWVLVCSNGVGDFYYGQTLVSILFGV